MLDLLARFQSIDRRIIYLCVLIVIALPLLRPIGFPILPSPEVRSLYQAIEEAPDDKLVVVAADWGAATKGECWPQTRAVIEHLMKSGQKFAIFGLTFQGPEFAQDIAEQVERERGYGRKYGVDWCNWGYKAGVQTTLVALAKDIPGTVKTDVKGQPIEELPVMRGVKDITDISLIVEFTGSGFLESYLMFIQGVYGVKMAQGCTAVIAPQEYNYLDSEQLIGLLPGMRGAAEYEKLVGYFGRASKAMDSQSFAHLTAILLIVLGNIGMWVASRRGAGQEAAQ